MINKDEIKLNMLSKIEKELDVLLEDGEDSKNIQFAVHIYYNDYTNHKQRHSKLKEIFHSIKYEIRDSLRTNKDEEVK